MHTPVACRVLLLLVLFNTAVLGSRRPECGGLAGAGRDALVFLQTEQHLQSKEAQHFISLHDFFSHGQPRQNTSGVDFKRTRRRPSTQNLSAAGRVAQVLPVVIILALAVSELYGAAVLSRTSRWTFKQGLELLAALVLYMVSGPAVILVNKHIMREHKFHYPILLASLGNALLMIVTRGAVATGLHKLEVSTMEWRRFFRVVIPVICLNFSAQVAGMWAYLFISVPLIQMLKSITIVLVLIFAYFVVNERVTAKLIIAVLIIATGTFVCTCFEHGASKMATHTVAASIIGVLLCLLGSSCEAGKTVFCQVLMDSLNVFDGLYWSSPLFTVLACIFVAAVELRGLVHYPYTLPLIGLLILNALLTGLIVLSSFWLTKLVGALALKVLMQARTIGLIVIAVLFFNENCSSMQYVGYSISLVGMWTFSSAKKTVKKAPEAAPAAPKA